jgi:hypothetical protein
VIVGLPVALLYGVFSGDWRLLIPWAIAVAFVFVFGRRGRIPMISGPPGRGG